MEREDDRLCIYYRMSCLKYYFFPSYCNGGKLIRGFSPATPVFPSPQKPAFSNSSSARNQVDEEPLCGCATCKSLLLLLLLLLLLNC